MVTIGRAFRGSVFHFKRPSSAYSYCGIKVINAGTYSSYDEAVAEKDICKSCRKGVGSVVAQWHEARIEATTPKAEATVERDFIARDNAKYQTWSGEEEYLSYLERNHP